MQQVMHTCINIYPPGMYIRMLRWPCTSIMKPKLAYKLVNHYNYSGIAFICRYPLPINVSDKPSVG